MKVIDSELLMDFPEINTQFKRPGLSNHQYFMSCTTLNFKKHISDLYKVAKGMLSSPDVAITEESFTGVTCNLLWNWSGTNWLNGL